MLNILKEQFESRKALTQSKYYGSIKREHWPKYYWDLYPLAQEYYHELNPNFMFNFYRKDFFNFTKVITVRDGYVNFASFILNHFLNIPTLGTDLYLIHPDLAPLVPPNASEYFATWNLVQEKKTTLQNAKKVIIFGFVSEQYLGLTEDVVAKVKELEKINSKAKVEIYLPLRKNVFELHGKESMAIHHTMSALKDVLGKREINILTGDQFFQITDFKDTYVFDLAKDRFMVSDNYLHYYVQSRGATVNNGSLDQAPTDSIFDLDLSIHHALHVCPLPKVKNHFTDLLFYKKQNPSTKDYVFEPSLHGLLREIL